MARSMGITRAPGSSSSSARNNAAKKNSVSPGDVGFRVEMLRRPAELPPRFVTAKPLVEPKTPGPFAEFGRDRVGGDDLRRLMPGPEASCEGPREAAHGKSRDRRTDIARSGRRAFERQC